MQAERRIYSVIEQEFGFHRDWYRIHDSDQKSGAIPISPDEAESWNKSGWGIFHTVQLFRGSRKKENLDRITSWAIDIDKGTKEKQLALMKKSPLYPNLVIESKNGLHIYWNSKNATQETYEAIVLDRLIPFFDADPRAKDVSRLLRVPGFFHVKNPKDPFLVKVLYWNPGRYTEDDMFYAFRLSRAKEQESVVKQELRTAFRVYGDNLWEKVFNLDCEAALTRLSGTTHVFGETYSFKKVSSGNLNIFVNNKSTSCWVDTNKRIGSPNGGGPTIFSWLKWFGRKNSEVVSIMKGEFPELWN